MTEPAVNWHPADIKAAVAKRGSNLARIAREHDIDPGTTSKALRAACYSGEQAIAAFLGIHPKVIWPTRYDERGNPRHARAHLFSNGEYLPHASQKCAAE